MAQHGALPQLSTKDRQSSRCEVLVATRGMGIKERYCRDITRASVESYRSTRANTRSAAFDAAIERSAAYADQTERDHTALLRAIEAGRVRAGYLWPPARIRTKDCGPFPPTD